MRANPVEESWQMHASAGVVVRVVVTFVAMAVVVLQVLALSSNLPSICEWLCEFSGEKGLKNPPALEKVDDL